MNESEFPTVIGPDAQFLKNHTVFGDGKKVLMRFPPRVNGQTHSDGDRHADLFVLFYPDGSMVDQLPIIEAVPLGLGGNENVLKARLFSAIWEMRTGFM